MSVTGPPGSGPWRVGIAISDTAAGTLLTQGVLAALLARDRTGRGQWVHTSLLEAMVSFMDFQATRWLIDGEVPRPGGQPAPDHGADGRVPDRRRPPQRGGHGRLRAVLRNWSTRPSSPTIRATPTFASRVEHRAALDADLARTLRTRTTAEWVERLADVVPCGPVLAVDEVFADPQVAAPRSHAAGRAPDPGRGRRAAPAAHVQRHAGADPAGPPADGAHTREVLAELGYDDDEIDDAARDRCGRYAGE